VLGLGAEGLVADFELDAALDREPVLFELELADDLDEVLLEREPPERALLDRLLPLLERAELFPEEPEDLVVVFSFWARTS